MTHRSAFALLMMGDLRALLLAPAQTLFTFAGICIAVALIVGVDLANDAARRGYALGAARLDAGVSHGIVRADGPLADRDYVRLLAMWRAGKLPGIRVLVPNVSGRLRRYASSEDARHAVDVLGVDLLNDGGARATTSQLQLVPALLSEPGAVMVGRGTGLMVGHGYQLARANGTVVTVQVRGELGGSNGAYRDLLIADIATAQELLGQVGHLSRIDVALRCASPTAPLQRRFLQQSFEESFQEWFKEWFPGLIPIRPALCATALMKALPDEYQLQSLAALRDEDLASGDAFYFNLGALSLLAAAVAALLVYQVVVGGVNRRALDFGRLRALGMTGTELGMRVVVDYLLLAAVAALCGVALGHALAAALVNQVAAVVDDLFYRLTVTDLRWSWLGVSKGVGVALIVALVASVGPALRLARTPVTMLLRGELDKRALVAPGVVALVSGVLAITVLLMSNGVWAALLSIACILIAAAAAIGYLVPRIRPTLRGKTVLVPLALADLTRTGRDASLALGALLVAVATAFGMSWMISSFRDALQDVLTQRLQAAVMVRFDVPLADLRSRLERLAGVTDVALAGQGEVDIGAANAGGGDSWRVALRVVDRPDRETARLGVAVGALATGSVVVSEPLARRHGIEVAQYLRVGRCKLRVGAVFREYGAPRGRVVSARDTAARCVVMPATAEAEIYGAVSVAAVRDALLGVSGVQIADQARIRKVSLEIFDRTFLITGVVRTLALIVAAIALFSSLTAWIAQRGGELGMLRAMGMTGRELAIVLGMQSLLLGAVAVLMALPVGMLIAWVLVTQLQPRAFGWSFPLVLHWQVIAPTLWAALAAVGAGALAPALTLARAPASRWLGTARHG